MAKGTTKTSVRKGAREDGGVSDLKPIDNKRTRMPADIDKMVRARQREAHEACRQEAALYAAASLTPEESARRSAALEQIARKMEIHDELVELRAVARLRAQRIGKLKL